jgi:hypothetical protein
MPAAGSVGDDIMIAGHLERGARAAWHTTLDPSHRISSHRKKIMKLLRLWMLIGAVVLVASPVGRTYAEGQSRAHTALKTRLLVSPSTINVGQRVTLSVVAPVPSTVHISFHSAHHSFTGTAAYQRSSQSYVVRVRLVPRVHGTEQARIVASVTPRQGKPYQLHGHFFIRGQAAPKPAPTASNGIPQGDGGDHDGDNNGGPSDGDGGV